MACIKILPLEVVHAVVAHIDTSDLPAVALVSHFFNVAATPELYASVRYTNALANKWRKIVCPLELISMRSDLLACLKSLELCTVPRQSDGTPPEFTRICLDVVKRAPALVSFSWGIYHNKKWYHQGCVLRATFDIEGPPSLDALLLSHLSPVKHIYLHEVSKEANKALLEWATSGPKDRLTSLSILGNYYLELAQLRQILDHAPNLKSLNITHCRHIVPSELLALIHDFRLESLELDLSIASNLGSLSTSFPTVPTLRRLLFDISSPVEEFGGQRGDGMNNPLTEQLLLHIIDAIKGIALHYLTLRLSALRALTLNPFNALMAAHALTLRELHLFELRVPVQLIACMIQHIPGLEHLSLVLRKGVNDLYPIIEALPAAHHLHTLTDTTSESCTNVMTDPNELLALDTSWAEQFLRAGPVLRHVVSLQLGYEWVKSYSLSEGEMKAHISGNWLKEL